MQWEDMTEGTEFLVSYREGKDILTEQMVFVAEGNTFLFFEDDTDRAGEVIKVPKKSFIEALATSS